MGLENKYHYSNWFSAQKERFELVEGVDYILNKVDFVNSRGRPTIDHILTQAAAVKIRAGNRKVADAIAQKVGQEELKRHQPQPTNPNLLIAAMEALQQNTTVIQALVGAVTDLQTMVEEQAPKVAVYEAIADAKTDYDMADAAKLMAIPGLGRNNLFQLLRDKKVLKSDNTPYQPYVEAGYMRCIVVARGEYTSVKTLLTGKEYSGSPNGLPRRT